MKRDLKLIPLDELKKVVGQILTVSKAEIDKAEAERPKRKRTKKRD
ncbi:MAG TPA: hypothetical protein VGZ02_16280 [Candidatus Baltobacteraceae bacterium]|nr:hypothetical protein [Candidatus Baltobacteraceae bacterium]